MNIIGTHDSMTANPVKYWWKRPLNLFAKCQSTPILETAKNGNRLFDIRVYWDKKSNNWGFAHGFIEYKYTNQGYYHNNVLDLVETLMIATHHVLHGAIYIRLILERTNVGEKDIDFSRFRSLCYELEENYTDISPVILFEGRYKKSWEQLYKFKYDGTFNLVQYSGSMAKDARWYEKLIPLPYAKRMNAVNIEKAKLVDGLVILDFYDSYY